MDKIISPQEAIALSSRIRTQKKTIVLTGGCFDILHIGHIELLKQAKQKGDFLFVFLENDKTVKRIKGTKRPINNQNDRAIILSSLVFIDYIINLSEMKSNSDYDKLILQIKPNIIVTTKGDNIAHHKKRQANLVGAKLFYIDKISNRSTTRLAKLISKDL